MKIFLNFTGTKMTVRPLQAIRAFVSFFYFKNNRLAPENQSHEVATDCLLVPAVFSSHN
jgi:hypothetical protein